MSGLGHTGPRASYVSYGPTLQALERIHATDGRRDGEPAGYGYSYADMAGGYTGALAALIALWHRRRTGQRPVRRSVAVRGGDQRDRARAARYRGERARAAAAAVRFAGRSGRARTASIDAARAGAARRSQCEAHDDRWVAISVRTQGEWERLVEAIGSPAWSSDAKFATLYLRMHNRDELDANLTRWTRERSAEDAMLDAAARQGCRRRRLQRRRHLRARPATEGARLLARRSRAPTAALSHVTGIPFKLSGGSGSVRTIAPDVGENNDYVLGALLGLSRAQREELIASGAVWD